MGLITEYRTRIARLSLLGLAAALPAGLATAQTITPATPRDTNQRIVTAWHERDLTLARTNKDLFVRPGLIADRRARSVRVYGESNSLKPGDPVEFLLIAENSGKDYESQAIAFALPSDVCKALEFIGLKSGAPVDASALRFWPRGERVKVTLDLLTTNGTATTFGRAESTVIDTRTNRPLSEVGFAFCGGRWTTEANGTSASTTRVYASDVYSPNSIISVYSEGSTVLDVPRRAAQQEVYTFQVPNPHRPLPAAGLVQFTFTPEFEDGAARLVDWTVRLGSTTNGAPLFTVTDTTGKVFLTRQPIDALAAVTTKMVASGRELYTVIVPDDTVELGALRTACVAVEALEDAGNLRVEPPPPGQPYYKAFLPNEKHRDRANRPIQPFELSLTASGTGATGVLTLATEDWKPGASTPTYRETKWPVALPQDLATPFSQKDAPAVLLVFAPRQLTYGQLRPYAAVAVERKMILFVFTGNEPLKSPVTGRRTTPTPP